MSAPDARGEALKHIESALAELDNISWEKVFQRVEGNWRDDLGKWTAKYVRYVREDLEKARAALAAAVPAGPEERET